MPDQFADSLFERYPLPPPPPSGGVGDMLGAFFGAAPDRTASYAKGLDAGATYRLRSAQGEQALETAHKQREERIRQEQINETMRKMQTPGYVPNVSDALTLSTSAHDYSNANLGFQEHGNRAVLGDPNATPAAQFAAGQAVQGKPLERYYQSGTGMQGDLMNPAAAPTMTPVGTAAAGADDALKNLRDRTDPNLHTGGSGGTVPLGVLPIIDDATMAIASADQAASLTNDALALLANGTVDLGLIQNLTNRGRNFLGESTPESKAYTTVNQALEKLRNTYLLTAKGVQTEGDADRAWKSEIGEAAQYDNALAKQQIERALGLIAMNKQAQYMRMENVYRLFPNARPPAALAGPGAAPPPAAPPIAAPPVAAPPAAAPKTDFATIEEAEAANLPVGTKITVGGRKATVR